MSYSLDKTDFPYVDLPSLGLSVGLFPVCKVQYEYFLGDPSGPAPDWYSSVLEVNPRRSWRQPDDERWPELFLTGVRADEGEAFARWLGAGHRLPTGAEWRAIDKDLANQAVGTQLGGLIKSERIHPAARSVCRWIVGNRRPQTLRAAGLFDVGVLEWVRLAAGGYGLYGRPDPKLYRILLNPGIHDPIRPRSNDRHRAFGFRLVRPLPQATGRP